MTKLDDSRPICFVVMGFGKKTDFESGQTFDLDATYEAIIAPAMITAGVRGIRADEIIHNGTIDVHMYNMLLRADLVIADISTGNVNAIYELGVRHALRPHSTIVMKESSGRLYFDLNHTSTFQYEHLGKDIGHKEALRAQNALAKIIGNSLSARAVDSPVYTFLPTLRQPMLSDEEFKEAVAVLEANQAQLSDLIKEARTNFSQGAFAGAVEKLKAALKIKEGDPYLTQQLALAVYKSKLPTELGALLDGMRVLESLYPDASNDPETLGISGAIRKRIWALTEDPAQLDAAIRYYRKGFEFTRDYYNGENLAICFALRATIQTDKNEKLYDVLSAKKVCQDIIINLAETLKSQDYDERADLVWIYATMSICSTVVGNNEESTSYSQKFHDLSPESWQIETFDFNKRLLASATIDI